MPGLFDLGNRPASGPPTNLFCVGSEPLRAVTRGKAPCAVDHPGRPQALSWGSPMMRLLCARDPAHELCTGRPRGSRGPIRGTPILEPPDGLLRCPARVLPVCPDLTFFGMRNVCTSPQPRPPWLGASAPPPNPAVTASREAGEDIRAESGLGIKPALLFGFAGGCEETSLTNASTKKCPWARTKPCPRVTRVRVRRLRFGF